MPAVVLATIADSEIADEVAAHLGLRMKPPPTMLAAPCILPKMRACPLPGFSSTSPARQESQAYIDPKFSSSSAACYGYHSMRRIRIVGATWAIAEATACECVARDDELFLGYGGHHTGTPEMGTDPRSSMVDPNCKVHGIENLLVANATTLPTSSQVNPMLTVVARSLRPPTQLNSGVESLNANVGTSSPANTLARPAESLA